MAYKASAIEIMIASPSDVIKERQVVRELIAEWNAVNSRRTNVCLMPSGWETHTAPELAGRPQHLINERILDHADLLVGIFWTRIGSPTGKSISGSVEEIERHLSVGKPVLLYFSTAPIVPENLDNDQFAELQKFKNWARGQGLVEQYESVEHFRDRFRNHLQMTLNENRHIQSLIAMPDPDSAGGSNYGSAEMSDEAQALLVSAASDSQGLILTHRSYDGRSVKAGKQDFTDGRDRRETERWIAAIEELYDAELLRDINGKMEIFELNNRGYVLAEKLKGF